MLSRVVAVLIIMAVPAASPVARRLLTIRQR